MNIEITGNTIGLWFIGFNKVAGDVMFQLERGRDKYLIIGRERIYDPTDPGNDAFSDKDTKNWFKTEIPTEVDQATLLKDVNELAEMYRDGFMNIGGGKITKILMDCRGVDNFMKRFLKLPFVHSRNENIREYKPEKFSSSVH
jgi:hypothetical protein